MKRTNLYITEEQVLFLGNLPGTIAEHVRRAIDEYIAKLKQSSASASKGGQHG